MLMNRIETLIFRHAAQQGLRHLARPDFDSGDPTLRALYTQLAKEFQTAPPMTLHQAAPGLLAGYWHAAREAYVVNPAGRALREAVAGEVSRLNTCPYCETVHEGMFAAAGGRKAKSAELHAAREWAAATLSPGSTALARPGFAPEDIPQIFATALLFHYTNRMASVFLEDAPVPLPGMATHIGQRISARAMALMARRIARHDAPPGQAVVQRRAELPAAFAWARPAPHVAEGLAHFALAAEEAGQEALPVPVRALVLNHLASWQGEAPPLSRGWLAPLIDPLPADQQPAARFALLMARAAWQVDDGLIADLRNTGASDRTLVQMAGWAAFAAARRIAGWFPGARDSGKKTAA